VSFGSLGATAITVSSSTQIIATAPAEYSGTVDVIVTTPTGRSLPSTSDQFTFVAPVPAVTSLSTTSGPQTGGTSITLTGSGLTGADVLYFGSTSTTSFTFTSDTSITVTAPASLAAGAVDVQVHTLEGGLSCTCTGDVFTYIAAPIVTGLSPTAGPLAGTTVVLTGQAFTGASSVYFGAQSASFTVNSATQITATAPAASAGTIHVVVTTVGGASAAGTADQFSYVAAPSVTGMTPGGDTASGGAPVTITGSNLSAVTSVLFGTASATFTIASDTSITAIAPAHAAGTVSVTVGSPGGTTNAGSFIYGAANAVTWVGGNGNWSTAANWTGGSLPTSSDDVVIPSGVTVRHRLRRARPSALPMCSLRRARTTRIARCSAPRRRGPIC
jgi:hypothetical protein